MIVKEILRFGIGELNNVGIIDSSLKVKILLAFCLGESREFLVSHDDLEVSHEVEKKFRDGLERLKENVPIQYITNCQEFMGLKFYVDENVLIPRDDTEIVVQEVLDNCRAGDKVLDLCTGSGAIGISVKKYKPEVKVFASDISLDALKVAKKNSLDNECEVEFIQSDLFESVEEKEFDIIVSNPPYICEDEMMELEAQVKKEPKIALFGGVDGLDFYRRIISEAKGYLKSGGFLIVEIGYNQREAVHRLFVDNGFVNIGFKRDLYGNDRVVFGRLIDG